MAPKRQPGEVRDAIIDYLSAHTEGAKVSEIENAVSERIGDVAPSSVRSYLRLNTPGRFIREKRGKYKVRKGSK